MYKCFCVYLQTNFFFALFEKKLYMYKKKRKSKNNFPTIHYFPDKKKKVKKQLLRNYARSYKKDITPGFFPKKY